MMKTILSNWNVMRWFRLGLGITAMVQSYSQQNLPLGLLAGFLLFTAIANIGCCGANGCAVSGSSINKKNIHEELDNNK